MKVDMNNPIIRLKQTSLLMFELKEQHKENIKFKLLLLKNKNKHNKGDTLQYNNDMIAIV